jgi:hypothetical protein
MPQTERKGLSGLLRRLVAERVELVVVGGYAAAARGVTLVTLDLDVCCRFDAANLMRLQSAVDDLHPYHRMAPRRRPLALTEASCAGLRNLYLATDWGPLDCLGEIAGLGAYDAVAAQSEAVELDGFRARLLTLDGLIRAKAAMDRPRDREALLQLRAIRERTRGG